MVKHSPFLSCITYHSLHRCDSVSCTELPLALPTVQFLFPYAYLPDVLLRASLTQSLLVLDCTRELPYSLFAVLAEWLYVDDQCPHHLIITLPSCILHVHPLSSVLLTHFCLFAPPVIPPHNCLVRWF